MEGQPLPAADHRRRLPAARRPPEPELARLLRRGRSRPWGSAPWPPRYEIATGIGTWGLNRTVGWAFDITNFVFWIGIGHAGTLISAILLLFRQKWRTSISRSAEAMTHLRRHVRRRSSRCIHMGRPWFGFWVFPYPNSRGPLWVNFRSPLLWDVFAISTYFTISLVFWYVGMIPDLATLRDRAAGRTAQADLRPAQPRLGRLARAPGRATRRCR